MPAISAVSDFSFLDSDCQFIMSRFLNSMVRHITDHKSPVTSGFMLFSLKVNPSVIKDIIVFSDNSSALSMAL